eukprot:scaffold7607_cov104-Isochrysis_galbana.AAC.2
MEKTADATQSREWYRHSRLHPRKRWQPSSCQIVAGRACAYASAPDTVRWLMDAHSQSASKRTATYMR